MNFQKGGSFFAAQPVVNSTEGKPKYAMGLTPLHIVDFNQFCTITSRLDGTVTIEVAKPLWSKAIFV